MFAVCAEKTGWRWEVGGQREDAESFSIKSKNPKVVRKENLLNVSRSGEKGGPSDSSDGGK